MENELLNLPGVGPKTCEKLMKLGINTGEDLLYYFPYRFEDRRHIIQINDLELGEKQLIQVFFNKRTLQANPIKGKQMVKVQVFDDTGILKVIFFNQPYIKNKILEKKQVFLFGEIKEYQGQMCMVNPDWIDQHDTHLKETFYPIYPLTKGISNLQMQKIIRGLFDVKGPGILPIIPESLMSQYKLIHRKKALKWMHYPPSKAHYQRAKLSLAFEELFEIQLMLAKVRNLQQSHRENKMVYRNEIEAFKKLIPYTLTGDQLKVIHDLINDMTSDHGMNRIVQGDVGSGKTITAFFAVVLSFCNGYQSAMMVPTELIAKQHYEAFKEIANGFGIRCGLLIGSMSHRNKQSIKHELEKNALDFVIGTHALLEEDVKFKHLGIVITDEQHRFGVRQRGILTHKGDAPHVFVMSATPIPRTLSLIVYGDLDISNIYDKPPGRKSIQTFIVRPHQYEKMIHSVKKQIALGKQVYFVAPSIKENDHGLESVEVIEDRLRKMMPEYVVKCVHGQMNSKDKNNIFQEFLNRKINVLVSTTVVEVGVNVPNASVMVIEGAERFGLSQLHQLRGRVGRSDWQSYCFLVTETKNTMSLQRLEIMTKSNDGFFIAEEDLKMRGPGDFIGVRQHGETLFKFANSYQYVRMIEAVRKEAVDILENNPNLDGEEWQEMKKQIEKKLELKKIILN